MLCLSRILEILRNANMREYCLDLPGRWQALGWQPINSWWGYSWTDQVDSNLSHWSSRYFFLLQGSYTCFIIGLLSSYLLWWYWLWELESFPWIKWSLTSMCDLCSLNDSYDVLVWSISIIRSSWTHVLLVSHYN